MFFQDDICLHPDELAKVNAATTTDENQREFWKRIIEQSFRPGTNQCVPSARDVTDTNVQPVVRWGLAPSSPHKGEPLHPQGEDRSPRTASCQTPI